LSATQQERKATSKSQTLSGTNMSSGQRLSSSGGSSAALPAEELRARRLAALSGRGRTPINEPITPQVRNGEQISPEELPASFLNDFSSLMFDPETTSDADKRRWFTQPIHTRFGNSCEEMGKEPEKHHLWGLIQTQGGPCGVIAALQAEMIQGLKIYEDIERAITAEEAKRVLCQAIATIIARCAVAPPVDSNNSNASTESISLQIVLPTDDEISIDDLNLSSGKLKVISILQSNIVKRPRSTSNSAASNLARATEDFLMENSNMKHFGRPSGVILFLLSLVKTRGVANIKSGKNH